MSREVLSCEWLILNVERASFILTLDSIVYCDTKYQMLVRLLGKKLCLKCSLVLQDINIVNKLIKCIYIL